MAYSDKGPIVPSQPRTLRGIALSHTTPAVLDTDVIKYDSMAGVPVQLAGGKYEDKADQAKLQPAGVKYAGTNLSPFKVSGGK